MAFPSSMMHRRGLQFVCVGLLLFAQQSALLHAIWHAAKSVRGGNPVAVHLGTTGHDDTESGGKNAQCAFDPAFGTVLGAINAGCSAALVAAAAADPQSWPFLQHIDPKPVRAVSRGPPAIS